MCLFFGFSGVSQTSVHTSGASGSGAGGSIEYSIGQTMYQSSTGTGGTISEGVQQPIEIYLYTNLNKNLEVGLKLLAYPNPVTTKLVLEFGAQIESKFSFAVVDVQGKIVTQNEVEAQKTEIDFESQLPGTYYLTVYNGSEQQKTFQIIKN